MENLKFRPSSNSNGAGWPLQSDSFSPQQCQISSDLYGARQPPPPPSPLHTLAPLIREQSGTRARRGQGMYPELPETPPPTPWINIKIPSSAPAASGQSTRDTSNTKTDDDVTVDAEPNCIPILTIGQRRWAGANSATLTKIAPKTRWTLWWPSFFFAFFQQQGFGGWTDTVCLPVEVLMWAMMNSPMLTPTSVQPPEQEATSRQLQEQEVTKRRP